MYLWMVMIAFSLQRLAPLVIEWQGRIRYERARAESVAVMARTLAAGGVVRDQRADGTTLTIMIPSPSSAGIAEPTVAAMAGDVLAHAR